MSTYNNIFHQTFYQLKKHLSLYTLNKCFSPQNRIQNSYTSITYHQKSNFFFTYFIIYFHPSSLFYTFAFFLNIANIS